MKAICVTASRGLEVRDIPTPSAAPHGHLVIQMEACAINHGDKTFLKMPTAAGRVLASALHDVWGASGSGRVVSVGPGVPPEYAGRQVAIYRSIGRTPESIGLWSEWALMPFTSCVILPDEVSGRDYCGSLVNVITAYAFLEKIAEAGHRGVIVTAGNSATGNALAALARRRNVPAIFLVRTEAAGKKLSHSGAEHVIVTEEGFTDTLAKLAFELGATAVFDGVGGELIGKIAPSLPMNSTVYFYGFLGGATSISIPSVVFMMKNLTLQRFSNFESKTVKEPQNLAMALKAIEGVIDDPLFTTKTGKTFSYDQVEQAMAYESTNGAKAVLVSNL